MQKTKIDYADYSVNPVKGICPNNCWYCYARKMYKRFKWNPEVRLDLKCLDKIKKIKKPSKIFVGSMHDIIGFWIPDYWITKIINKIREYKKHTFMFLTKFPQRYQYFKFPKNCWLGATITGEETEDEILNQYWGLDKIKNKKFISFEPLLKMPYCFYKHIDWVIIGGLTGHKYNRPGVAINEILIWCFSENIPIFIKDNLKWEDKIQEFPKI